MEPHGSIRKKTDRERTSRPTKRDSHTRPRCDAARRYSHSPVVGGWGTTVCARRVGCTPSTTVVVVAVVARRAGAVRVVDERHPRRDRRGDGTTKRGVGKDRRPEAQPVSRAGPVGRRGPSPRGGVFSLTHTLLSKIGGVCGLHSAIHGPAGKDAGWVGHPSSRYTATPPPPPLAHTQTAREGWDLGAARVNSEEDGP